MKRWLIERGGLLALVTLALYVWLAPTTIIDGDNAELSTLAVDGGAAHPPGYPLYVLWLRALSWLPGASPAHTAAIATAVLGALAVLALHAACRAWGAKPLAATLAVTVFATGPVVIRLHSEAEVFALNHLLVALVLWLAAEGGPLRGNLRGAALGLVAGLGLANHLTCVLVAPVGILGVVRATRESRPAIACAIGGLVIGLSPYAYLLVAPDSPMSWGKVETLGDLVRMFLREDYGGATTFQAHGEAVSTLESLAALARTVGRGWLYAPALFGLFTLGRRLAHREARVDWAMLALAWVCACALVLRFNVPPHGLGLYVCQRFHLLPLLLLAIPIAVGLSRFEIPRRFAAPAVLAVGVASTALSLSYIRRIHSPAMELAAKNLLRSLPQNAVVIHGQDELHAGTGYVQSALGVRPDVVVITWPMDYFHWYRMRHARRGIPPNHAVPLVETALAGGRAVFCDKLQRELLAHFPAHPYGTLYRLYPRGATLPSVEQVAALNADLFSHFELGYARPGPDDEYATEVHLRYRATWEIIAKMLASIGKPAEAQRAADTAQQLGPHP